MPPYSPTYRLSPHFQLHEFVRSETADRLGIDNYPNARQLADLERVAAALEPARARWGPIHISSGLRIPAVNRNVAGSAKNSAHQYGRAADWKPASVIRGKVRLRTVMEWGVRNLVFDRLIYEYGGWIHLSVPIVGRPPRHNARMKFKGTRYLAWVPQDPRVR